MFLVPMLACSVTPPSQQQLAAWQAIQAQATQAMAATTPQPPVGVLGPPAHFAGLETGPYELAVTRSDALDGSEIAFGVRRIADRPAAFHLRGLLSEQECDAVMQAAEKKSMAPAMTASGDARTGCGVAWLPVDTNPVAAELAAVFGELLLSEDARDASSWGRGAGFEKMQVLKYESGGEFRLHMDANEEVPRMLTVLLYLNGRGETWFPLAGSDLPNPRSRRAALQACAELQPGKDGLLVAPAKGDAVAFYNFADDGSGALERRAFHAGLPAPDGKSIAAMWYQLDPWQKGSRLAVQPQSSERRRAKRPRGGAKKPSRGFG